MQPSDPALSTIGTLAVAFTESLASGAYQSASRMLAPELQTTLSAAGLQANYEAMVSDQPAPANAVELLRVEESDATAAVREGGDAGWALVAVYGDGWQCMQAVTVSTVRIGERLLIRDVEWGRP